MRAVDYTGPPICDIHKVELILVDPPDNQHFLKCPVKGCKFTRYKG